MARHAPGLLMALVIASGPAATWAQGAVAPALAAYQRGELDQAAQLFRQALETPGNSPETLVVIHRHLGILASASGDHEAARAAFEVSLALDPEQEAPSELGGAQRAPFDAARTAREGRRLRVEVQLPPAAVAAGAEVAVAATDAPEALVDAMRIRVRSGERPEWFLRLDGAGPHTVAIPSSAISVGAATTVTAEALDRHGGVVGTAQEALLLSTIRGGGAVDGPDLPASSPTDRVVRRSRHDLTWLWITLGVVGGVLVAGAITFTAIVYASDHQYAVGPPHVE